jgi:transcriptional regulator with XRE-family HTH domain
MNIHAAIKTLRATVMGWSQQRFATEVQISINGLANYERTRTPTLLTLARILRLAYTKLRKDSLRLLEPKVAKALFDSYISIRAAYLDQLKKESPKSVLAFTGRRLVDQPNALPVEQGGLLFQTIENSKEFRYASTFADLMKALRDPRTEGAARKILESLVSAAEPLTKHPDMWIFEHLKDEIKGGRK